MRLIDAVYRANTVIHHCMPNNIVISVYYLEFRKHFLLSLSDPTEVGVRFALDAAYNDLLKNTDSQLYLTLATNIKNYVSIFGYSHYSLD